MWPAGPAPTRKTRRPPNPSHIISALRDRYVYPQIKAAASVASHQTTAASIPADNVPTPSSRVRSERRRRTLDLAISTLIASRETLPLRQQRVPEVTRVGLTDAGHM